MTDVKAGLTSNEANKILREYGENIITVHRESIFKTVFKQLLSPIVGLLILAASVSFYLGEIIDGYVITTIIIINSILGFFNEYKAKKSYEKLQSFIPSYSIVIRDSKTITIEKRNIVPGDIVHVKLGDIVPADLYILEQEGLFVDESSISGESIQIPKKNYTGESNVDSILFSGSCIVKGYAKGLVFATGINSNFGKIANLSINTEKKTQYEEHVKLISKSFLIVALLFIVIIFCLHLFIGRNNSFIEILLFTVAIAITIIPEALPILLTISLSNGAMRIGTKGAVVKRLTAVEDLGNIDILCTDKTGTLTMNSLTVKCLVANDEGLLLNHAYNSCFDGSDQFDIGINKYLKKIRFKPSSLMENYVDVPFDPEKKCSERKFSNYSILKGAPEAIIKKSIADKDKQYKIIRDIELISDQGFRPISFASNYSGEMEYIGTIFFVDPIKDGVREVVKKAKNSGIAIKVITGDSKSVGRFLGREVGLVQSDSQVIEASQLSFNNQGLLKEEVHKYTIFARADPMQKYKIIEALQYTHSVGYLGDGINDAPSLKLANVGIVVDSATDIAKSAADMIITSHDLNVITESIIEGRKSFENINKYLKHTLAGNFGNFFTIGVLSLFLPFLPILPIQILINNLLIDIPSIAYAGDNVDDSEIKKPKNNNIVNLLKFSLMIGAVSSIFDFICFFTFQNLPSRELQTTWFVFSTLTELLIILSIRTNKPIIKSFNPSPLVFYTTILAIIFCLVSVFVGIPVLSIEKISTINILIIIAFSLCYLLTTEIVKNIYYKRNVS